MMNDDVFLVAYPTMPPNSAICLFIDVFKLMARMVFKNETRNVDSPKADLFSTA